MNSSPARTHHLLTSLGVGGHFVTAFLQVLLELGSRALWEYLVQTLADRVELVEPQRVAVHEGGSLKVHVNLILRYRACHELSVATQDIATIGLYLYRVALQAVCHLRPVLLLGGHDIEGLADNSYADYRQHQGYRHVAGHYFLIAKLAHFLSLSCLLLLLSNLSLWNLNDIGRLVCLM